MAPPEIRLRMADTRAAVIDDPAAHHVDFTILQLNDVYEATPVEGGRRGGLARVATLIQRLTAENPNTISVLVGDFLAPSAIGATTHDAGVHMVEALGAMGLTYATMGNHEFDVGEAELRQRIRESHFAWIVANVKDGQRRPFDGVAEHTVHAFTNRHGAAARVALFGVCIELVEQPWLTYEDPLACARRKASELAASADVLVAMTHLAMAQDRRLAVEVPRIDVLLGGHEHEAARAIVGADATPIFKADSNARTAFVHRFRHDADARTTLLWSEIVAIDASLPEHPATAAAVDRWQQMTYATLRAQGHEPLEIVGLATEALDGAEADLRKQPTNLGQLIAETFLAEVPAADAVLFPAGQIRIDGVIPPGDILYYDVVRIFPLGGKLSVLALPGAVLRALLDPGAAAVGQGGFLILHEIRKIADVWHVGGAPLVDDQVYKIVASEVPAAAFAYPPFKASGAAKLYDTRDMRDILTDRLRRDRDRLLAAT